MPPIPTNPPLLSFPGFWNQQWAANMSPLCTGVLSSFPIVSQPGAVVNPAHGVGVGSHWCPAPHEMQIWVAPAGWAEAAYLSNQPIDVSDELIFLDQIRSQEVEIKTTYETSSVRLTGGKKGKVMRHPVTTVILGGITYIGPSNTYDKMFPINETRDILLLVENNKGKAIAVISKLMVTGRELVARVDDHVLYESITLVGENFHPLKEIE